MTLTLTLAMSGEAETQNLITNPDFDSDLAGWTILDQPNGQTVWNGLDGSPTIGSAQLQLSDPASGSQVLSQCIDPNSVSLPWHFGGRARIVAATSGNSLLVITFWNEAGCTGASVIAPVGTVGTVAGVQGSFFQFSGSIATDPMPGGSPTLSAELSAVVFPPAPGSQGSLTLNYDKLYFGPEGTTPVILQSFEVD